MFGGRAAVQWLANLLIHDASRLLVAVACITAAVAARPVTVASMQKLLSMDAPSLTSRAVWVHIFYTANVDVFVTKNSINCSQLLRLHHLACWLVY